MKKDRDYLNITKRYFFSNDFKRKLSLGLSTVILSTYLIGLTPVYAVDSENVTEAPVTVEVTDEAKTEEVEVQEATEENSNEAEVLPTEETEVKAEGEKVPVETKDETGEVQVEEKTEILEAPAQVEENAEILETPAQVEESAETKEETEAVEVKEATDTNPASYSNVRTRNLRTASRAADGSPTYLSIGQNYYTNGELNLGNVLTAKVSEFVPAAFTRLQATYGAELTADMTVLEFWSKFGYAPEDRYFSRNNVIDAQGRTAIASNRENPQTTFEMPHKLDPMPAGSLDMVKSPNLFSRITVGNKPDIWHTTDKTWTWGGRLAQWLYGTPEAKNLELMNDLIGYGWDNTVDDYILNPENGNKVVIPTRFNTERDDVWLTMRGGSPDRYGSWLTGARAYLSAVSASGKQMAEKSDSTTTLSDDFYINTTTKLGVSDEGFDSLGDNGKYAVGVNRGFEIVNNGGTVSRVTFQDLRDRLVTNFTSDVSTALASYEGLNEKKINLGVGGQIQLKGLYRLSDLDNATLDANVITEYANYLSDQQSRLDESTHVVDVEYYMHKAGDQTKLYSPNKSVFQIETTRPLFTNFGDLGVLNKFATSENLKAKLDEKLGYESFGLEDKGVDKEGFPIGTDKNNVRVMITVEGEIKERNLTIDQMLNSLSTNPDYANKEIVLFYTYAGLDTEKTIDGLLPIEITTNTGAYAVPIARTILITQTVLEENHSYLTVTKTPTVNGDAVELSEAITDTEVENRFQTEDTKKFVDDSTTTTQDLISPTDISGFTLVSIEKVVYDKDGVEISKEQLTPADFASEVSVSPLEDGGKIVFNYVYERVLGSVVTVKHQTTTGDVLIPHKVATDVNTGELLEKLANGTNYVVAKDSETIVDENGLVWKFKEVSGDPEVGSIEKEVTTVVYVYEKLEGGSVTAKFVDENGNEIKLPFVVLEPGTQVGTPYKSTSEKTIVVDGKTYTFVALDPNSAPVEGKVVEGNLEIIYVYKLVEDPKPEEPKEEPKPEEPKPEEPKEEPKPQEPGTKTTIKVEKPNPSLPNTGTQVISGLSIISGITLMASGAYFVTKKKKEDK